jgi:hypothetical protein
MKKFLFTFFCLMFIATTSVMYGATITAQNGAVPNNWNLTTTWVGGVLPTSADDVIIPTGVTVIMEAGGKVCRNITIQSGGLLYGNSVVSSPKYLRVYGTTMTVDGTFGGVADAAGISPYVAAQTLTITGSGTCNVSRIQPSQAGQTVIIDISMGINYAGGSGTGSTGLYSAAKDNYTVTINAGKTVTMANSSYVSVDNSSGDAAGVVNMTINVYGTLTCSGANSKFNLNTAAGKTASLTIYSGGIVNLYSYFRGNASNLGTVNVNVNSGGTLNGYSGSFFDLSTAASTINGTVDFGSSSTATRSIGTAAVGSTGKLRFMDGTYPTGAITLNSGSTVEYYGGSAIVLGASPTTYSNLMINNSAGVSLGTSVAVNSNLTLSNGLLTLGSYNLTLSGAVLAAKNGESVTNWVAAEGTGEFRKEFTGPGSFTFPVGDNTGTAEYSPVTLNFTSGSFASAYAGVKLVNAQHPSPLLPPTDYLNRYWTVSQSGISSFSCDATFKYVDADITGSESNLYLLKYDSPNWTPLTITNTVTNELSGTVTSFSDFWGANIGAGPVELSSFNVNTKNGVVQLSWRTISETNSLKFNIERKSANSEWMNIGEISATGNSNSPKDYSFVDKNVIAGKYQYRIKMIDADGSYEYSNTVETEVSLPSEFSLLQNYPNPFNPSTTISYSLASDSRVTLELYSLIGEKITDLVNKEQTTGYYSYNFNTSNMSLTSGLYIYKITAVSKSNEVFTQSRKMLLLK